MLVVLYFILWMELLRDKEVMHGVDILLSDHI